MRDKLPRRLGQYRGKTYWRYTVILEQSGIGWQHRHAVEIVASSPGEACNAIRQEFAPMMQRPTTFTTVGPKGGLVERLVGWEGLVWAGMVALDRQQTEFAFGGGL